MQENDRNIIKTHIVEVCPICKSEGNILYYNLSDRIYQSKGTWSLIKCKNSDCELIWLDPRPNLDQIWKVYDNYYTHSDKDATTLSKIQSWIENGYIALKYHYKGTSTLLQKIIGFVVFFLPTEKVEYDFNISELTANETGSLLDVGCGSGSYISRMKKLGWNVEGIDSDIKAVNYCKKNGLNVKSGSLESQKYKFNKFDVVVLNHVIEHVYEPEAILKEILRILKPGGQLVIATPNACSWMFNNKFRSNWFSLQTPGHVNIFNRKNLNIILEKVGYKIQLSKTSARNEFYVYVGSRAIKDKGRFAMGIDKLNKIHIIIGKFYQLMTSLLLLFYKDAGGELFVKAKKIK